MAKKVTHPDGARIMAAFNAKPARERNEIFAAHEPAYRLVNAIGAGHIDPTALTTSGAAAVHGLAEAVGVDAEEADEPAKRASKKDESNQ